MTERVAELLDELFGGLRPFVESPRWQLQRRWRSTFASDVPEWNGPLIDCSWHAFSYGAQSCLRGADATAAFEERMESGSAIIITEEPSLRPAYTSGSAPAVRYARLSAVWTGDLYVIAADWSWTFVTTHEQGWLGPFFASATRVGDEGDEASTR